MTKKRIKIKGHEKDNIIYNPKLVVTLTCPYCRKGIASTVINVDEVSNRDFIRFPACSNKKCRQTAAGFQVRWGYLKDEGRERYNMELKLADS